MKPTQPPCKNLSAFEPKNAKSMVKKNSATGSAFATGQRQGLRVTM
jgi:hypothetical protein